MKTNRIPTVDVCSCKAIFTLCRIAFSPSRKLYRMRLLFAHKKSCGGANLWRSVSLKQRVTYRIGVHSLPDTAFRGATKSRIRHSAFGWTCLNYVVPVFNRLTSSEISIYENWRKLLKRSRELEKRTQRKKKTSPNNKDKRFVWAVRDFLTRTRCIHGKRFFS